jgi:hypothetical protein
MSDDYDGIRFNQNIEITFEISQTTLDAHSGGWLIAARESIDEFVSELEAFLKKHPIVRSANTSEMDGKTLIPPR